MKSISKSKELRKMQNIVFKTKNIPITDNREEMGKIGRRIFDENTHIYNEKIVKEMHSFMNEVMPVSSAEEKDLFFYGSIYDYWVYGNSVREEFYYDFIHKTHQEKQTYLTMRKRMLYFAYLNDDTDRDICSNKWKCYNYFKDFYKRDVMLLEKNPDEKSFQEFEQFIEKNPEFIIKPLDLGEGDGVEKLSLSDLGEGSGKRHMFEELQRKREDLLAEYAWGDSSAVLLEEILVPTDAFKIIHPQSVNFVRCPTIWVDNKVTIYHPWLICGNGGEFFIKGYGNYNLAGIDPENGTVVTKLANEHREFYECHPDTNVRIPGFVIPRWDELIKTVTEMSEMLPNVRYVAWDMVLTDKYGWVPIEANDDGEPLWQLCFDKGFKDELDELIGWQIDESRFWWELVSIG